MPIPANLVKWVIGGTLPGNEIFQTSFWIKTVSTPAVNDTTAAAAAASAQFVALGAALKAAMTTGSAITSLDQYGYTGGNSASQHGHATLNIVGTSTTPHPNQICLVATLRTATASRNARGRMYLPTNGIQMAAAGGIVPTGSVPAIADALAALFTAQQGSGDHVSVVSQTLSTTYPVLTVSMDNIPDTQRRRRNKMIGTTYTKAV